MILADAKEAKLIDKKTTEEYKIPSLLLMENAGLRVSDEAKKTGKETFAVICGKGNNGGDGLVAARHLFCAEKNVTVILIDNPAGNDASVMLECAKNIGVPIVYGFCDEAKKVLEDADVLIDAIFGIGFSGVLKEPYKSIITYINKLKKYVVAVDVPSGADASYGNVSDSAVKCKKTVTFGVGRTGLLLYPAKDYSGEIVVCDISFAPSLYSDIKAKTITYAGETYESDDCHKGTKGKLLVVAGSLGMTGASYIASTSALKSGCGVVSLCIPEFLNPVMEQKLTEVMTIPLPDNKKTFSKSASEKIIEESKNYDALLIGCGMGANEDTKSVLNDVLTLSECKNIIIDADGINVLDKEKLKDCGKNVVITPHIGEMSRLTGLEKDYIKSNLVKVAADFSAEYKVAVVLKCATTVVAFENGNVYINTFSNSGMATAGSGDALAGIIGAFLSKEKSFETAVLNGVYVHSKSGEITAGKVGKTYMSAMDIVNNLSLVFKSEGK